MKADIQWQMTLTPLHLGFADYQVTVRDIVIHVGGKLIRYCKQAQRYVNGETFYRLYILSVILNCHMSIVLVLSTINFSQQYYTS